MEFVDCGAKLGENSILLFIFLPLLEFSLTNRTIILMVKTPTKAKIFTLD